MKTLPLLGLTLLVTSSLVLARGGDGGGGGGFREGGMDDAGFRDEAPRLNEDSMDTSVRQDDVNVDRDGDDVNVNRDGNDVNVDRTGDDNYRVSDINGSADVNVRPRAMTPPTSTCAPPTARITTPRWPVPKVTAPATFGRMATTLR